MVGRRYDPWPPGYQSLTVAQIDGVSCVPDGGAFTEIAGPKAVVLFTSTAGQKVCLVAALADLRGALDQIEADPAAKLRVIEGGAVG